ncbi:Phosphoenolpyruvate synthase [uncultured archaeon]|nr:Phosphoenolpyruvate synthase [uncultured archaeon]
MIFNLEETKRIGNSCGNKARSLSILTNEGVQIPIGIVADFTHYYDYLKIGRLTTHFLKDILRCLDTVPGPYAVRSSANVEDSSRRSYAGQFKTKLNVPRSRVEEAICEVYDSARNPKGFSYNPEVLMGLLIQQMIPSDISGVIFTYDIVNQSSDSIVAEFLPGECERLVSGKTNPSMIILEKSTGKTLLFERGQESISLDGQKKMQILNNATRIEGIFKSPQDIEFLLNSNKFYCLQSRDITSL